VGLGVEVEGHQGGLAARGGVRRTVDGMSAQRTRAGQIKAYIGLSPQVRYRLTGVMPTPIDASGSGDQKRAAQSLFHGDGGRLRWGW